MLGNIGASQVLILLLVLVVLFGASRLPKAAEGIGKSLRVFKREINSNEDETTTARADADARPVQDETVSQQGQS